MRYNVIAPISIKETTLNAEQMQTTKARAYDSLQWNAQTEQKRYFPYFEVILQFFLFNVWTLQIHGRIF